MSPEAASAQRTAPGGRWDVPRCWDGGGRAGRWPNTLPALSPSSPGGLQRKQQHLGAVSTSSLWLKWYLLNACLLLLLKRQIFWVTFWAEICWNVIQILATKGKTELPVALLKKNSLEQIKIRLWNQVNINIIWQNQLIWAQRLNKSLALKVALSVSGMRWWRRLLTHRPQKLLIELEGHERVG